MERYTCFMKQRITMRVAYPLKWLQQNLGIAKLRIADVFQKGSDEVLAERVAHLLDSFT